MWKGHASSTASRSYIYLCPFRIRFILCIFFTYLQSKCFSPCRSPWLFPDTVFYLTPMGREFTKNCNYVHKVAEDVINARREALVCYIFRRCGCPIHFVLNIRSRSGIFTKDKIHCSLINLKDERPLWKSAKICFLFILYISTSSNNPF